jgi:hypothetical protein
MKQNLRSDIAWTANASIVQRRKRELTRAAQGRLAGLARPAKFSYFILYYFVVFLLTERRDF